MSDVNRGCDCDDTDCNLPLHATEKQYALEVFENGAWYRTAHIPFYDDSAYIEQLVELNNGEGRVTRVGEYEIRRVGPSDSIDPATPCAQCGMAIAYHSDNCAHRLIIEQQKQLDELSATRQKTRGPPERGAEWGEVFVSEARARIVEASRHIWSRVMRHRERYLRAWVAETGLLPSASELVEERLPMGDDNVVRVVFRVQRKTKP